MRPCCCCSLRLLLAGGQRQPWLLSLLAGWSPGQLNHVCFCLFLFCQHATEKEMETCALIRHLPWCGFSLIFNSAHWCRSWAQAFFHGEVRGVGGVSGYSAESEVPAQRCCFPGKRWKALPLHPEISCSSATHEQCSRLKYERELCKLSRMLEVLGLLAREILGLEGAWIVGVHVHTCKVPRTQGPRSTPDAHINLCDIRGARYPF